MKNLSLVCFLAFASVARSQTIADHNGNAWFMYFGDHPFTKTSKWGAHLEAQWRRTNFGAQWQQYMMRPALNYQLNSKVSLTGGYGYVQTYPYGADPVAHRFPEHRFFEQATITQRFLNLDWTNRFRQEQRYLGVMARQTDGTFQRTGWRYENRTRYMLRTTIPLPGADKRNYLAVSNEIFYNFGRNVARNVFDQNRAYVAYGRDLGHQTKLELGFLEQTIQHRDGRVFEHNHTLQFAIYSKLPFFGD